MIVLGFLGKKITRAFNKIWNYGVMGFLGTTLICTLQPILTVLNVVLSVGRCLGLFVALSWRRLVVSPLLCLHGVCVCDSTPMWLSSACRRYATYRRSAEHSCSYLGACCLCACLSLSNPYFLFSLRRARRRSLPS